MKISFKNIRSLIKDSSRIYKRFNHKTDCSLVYVLIRYIFCRIVYKKNIIAHKKVKIKGIQNIDIKGALEIGLSYFGLLHPLDITFLNIRGRLIIIRALIRSGEVADLMSEKMRS